MKNPFLLLALAVLILGITNILQWNKTKDQTEIIRTNASNIKHCVDIIGWQTKQISTLSDLIYHTKGDSITFEHTLGNKIYYVWETHWSETDSCTLSYFKVKKNPGDTVRHYGVIRNPKEQTN